MSAIRLLTAGETFHLDPIRQRTDFELHTCEDPDEAALALSDREVSGLLVDPSLDISCALELLGLWRGLGLRLPVVALIPPALAADLPLRWSPLLHLADPDLPPEKLTQVLHSAIEASAVPQDREYFRTSDFVQLALLSQQSVELHLSFARSDHLQIEIVGGDIWSAFGGDSSGIEPLANHLQDTPHTLQASVIEKLPKQRFLREPAPHVLRRCLRHHQEATAADDSALPPSSSLAHRELLHPGEDPSPDTQPLPTDLLNELTDASGEEVAERIDENEFEQHFQAGMDAALVRDYERALRCFEKAQALRPDDARVSFNVQRIRQRLEN